MIGWLLKALDPAPDREIGALIGAGYGRSISLLGWCALGCLTVLAASIFTLYSGRNVPVTSFRLVDRAGKVSNLESGVSPLLSGAKVGSWVERALIDSNSFNFVNIDEKAESSRIWFEPLAYNEFYASLRSNHVVDTVKNYRLNVWLIPLAPATIVSSFAYNGSVYWNVELSALISFTGDNPQASQRTLFKILVHQAPTVDSSDGLTIVKLETATP
jgi:hypothetical protein